MDYSAQVDNRLGELGKAATRKLFLPIRRRSGYCRSWMPEGVKCMQKWSARDKRKTNQPRAWLPVVRIINHVPTPTLLLCVVTDCVERQTNTSHAQTQLFVRHQYAVFRDVCAVAHILDWSY